MFLFYSHSHSSATADCYRLSSLKHNYINEHSLFVQSGGNSKRGNKGPLAHFCPTTVAG